jgi:type IV pilus assembly protein PilC
MNMYASGEASGQLEHVAAKMATHYEKEHRLNGKVKSAMTYPTVLLSVTVVVVLAIFTLVLPQFFEIFEGAELPAITRGVIAISNFLTSYWYYTIIGGLMLVAFVRFLLTIPKIRHGFDKFKLSIKVIGPLLKIIYTARFARTLSSLYSSGIPMLRALDISSTIIGNKFIEGQFGEVILKVRNGEPLSASVGEVIGFDKKMAASIMIGEETGRLDSMLEGAADSFDFEAEMATSRLVQLVEPFMIVFMGLVIGVIMLSVMLPIFSLYDNVQNM